jgi:hypothetical protein
LQRRNQTVLWAQNRRFSSIYDMLINQLLIRNQIKVSKTVIIKEDKPMGFADKNIIAHK